jgi:hypothetical protein
VIVPRRRLARRRLGGLDQRAHDREFFARP